MNKNCTFYIVRHGETDWNVIRRIQGQLDHPELNENGIKQAKETSEKLKNIHFDAIFSSDLFRTRKTAEILNLERQLEIQTSKALRERTFGKHEGLLADEYAFKIKDLLEKFNKMPVEQKWKFKPFDDHESDEEIVTRFMTFLRETAVAYPGKTVLIVTHGGCIRTFLAKLEYVNYEKWTPYAFKNAGYLIVESDGVEFFIKEVNGIDRSRLHH